MSVPRARRTFGASAARLLETGLTASPAARALSAVWARSARVSRPLAIPRGVAVIGVGGSTLGGSYKTPLVLALARALAERGETVAVVAHGYRAPGRTAWSGGARRAVPDDSVRSIGDDALWLARELSPLDVPVVVGRNRNEALRGAASLAPLVIVDALLQATPERLALSVLTLSAARPWGAGHCPPAGDLRAPRDALLVAADVVARIRTAHHAPDSLPEVEPELHAGRCSVFDVTAGLGRARNHRGESVSLSSLAGARVGVVLAVARPDRVLSTLAAVGVFPEETRIFGDHAAPHGVRPSRAAARGVDVWLTTPKCATKMRSTYEGAPLLALELQLTLPAALLGAVTQCRPH